MADTISSMTNIITQTEALKGSVERGDTREKRRARYTMSERAWCRESWSDGSPVGLQEMIFLSPPPPFQTKIAAGNLPMLPYLELQCRLKSPSIATELRECTGKAEPLRWTWWKAGHHPGAELPNQVSLQSWRRIVMWVGSIVPSRVSESWLARMRCQRAVGNLPSSLLGLPQGWRKVFCRPQQVTAVTSWARATSSRCRAKPRWHWCGSSGRLHRL